MKHIRLRIIDLLDQHKGTFETCQGCAICAEIKQLRKSLERDPAVKYKHILDKGQDMTKSDIAFLLESEVDKKMIRKALKMQSEDFLNMMVNFGFSKRRKLKEEEIVGKIEMTAEEFVDLKFKQHLTMTKIAQLKGVAGPSMYGWTERHRDEIKKALKALNLPTKAEKPVETAKAAAAITIQKLKQPEQREAETKALEPKPIQTPHQPVTAEEKKAPCNCLSKEEKAEYERLIAALRSDLTEAHKQLDERDEKIRELEQEPAGEDSDGRNWEADFWALMHEKEELERKFNQQQDMRNELQETARIYRIQLDDAKKELLAVEKEKEELQSKYETTLNVIERLNEHIKGLKLEIKPLEEENQAMRLLIKKWA